MNIVCLDLEGVLVPEIWIAFAEKTGISEFRRTTRDEPDYDKLMRYRLDLLERHSLGIKEIQDVIATIEPLEGDMKFPTHDGAKYLCIGADSDASGKGEYFFKGMIKSVGIYSTALTAGNVLYLYENR